MLPKEKIDRINELGRRARFGTLTEEEKKEQAALRMEYIVWFRAAIRGEAAPSHGDEEEE